MSDNRVSFTYDEYRAAGWSRDGIISGEAGPVRGRIPLEGEPSLASGDPYSYPPSQFQPLVSRSGYSSGHSGRYSDSGTPVVYTADPGRQYIPTFDNPSIAQPQPQTAQQFHQSSPPPLSINSSALNPSIINPQEVQDYGSLAAAHNYAQVQSATRDFVEGQRELSPPSRVPSSIYAQSSSSPVTWDQLQTEIPGAKYIPLKDGELPYGTWSTVPWDSGYNPGFQKTHPRNKGPVADLWRDTWQGQEGCEEERICLMFDHVDLYRLAYITTVHLGSVERPDTMVEGMKTPGGSDLVNWLRDIVEILNEAGRPPGFGGISHRRPDAFNQQQVRDLFAIMANRDNINRGNAFNILERWVWLSGWSPRLVLRNVPETIVSHWKHSYQTALTDRALRWDWRIKEFIYEETVDSKGRAVWALKLNKPGSQPSGSTSKEEQPSGSMSKEQQPMPSKHLRRHIKHSRPSTSSSSRHQHHSQSSNQDVEYTGKGKKPRH
ncbi:uncharacterized protein Bfra_007633 [Botrytis fragariae]|uniref:Uncharacterized protein n=1 Tax=Botrytis fragariae TaxID=1964551 RepID=A0A8H6APT1_9HELO|nr:uncharacterized protein Bfra_007633 [Botrytis fragariae]KAF5871120.1 hypothetical protein Bfra_007633 [Botrytis fragariae]